MQFSVLMSVYHLEKPVFLNQCLQSLLKQTIIADEIVLVFDGKLTNELEQVVDQYARKLPLKIIRLEQNLGLGKALNYGLSYCTYPWVFRMDSDDICVENRFELQLDYIKQNPDVVLFGGQIIEFTENIDEQMFHKNVPLTDKKINSLAQKRNPFNHVTVAYKKDVIFSVGGYQHHLFFEDYNLWLRIMAKGYKVANIAEPLVYVRVGNDMIARRRGWLYIKSEWKLFRLKMKLGIQGFPIGFGLFLLRAFPRLLPSFILGYVYKKVLRKNL